MGAWARNMRVYGYIVDTDNRGIEFVNAYSGTGSDMIGTTSNKNGYYELLLPEQDTVQLTFSMVGYTTVVQRLLDPGDVVNINVQMTTDEQWLEQVEVRGLKRTTGTMDEIDGVFIIIPIIIIEIRKAEWVVALITKHKLSPTFVLNANYRRPEFDSGSRPSIIYILTDFRQDDGSVIM